MEQRIGRCLQRWVNDLKKWQILLNIILEIFIFLLCSILGIIFIPKLLGFFWPFVASAVLAFFAAPVCAFLERKIRLNKKWASALILIAVILGLAVLGYFLILMLGKELASLLMNMPGYYQYWGEKISGLSLLLSEKVKIFNPDYGNAFRNSVNHLVNSAGSIVNNMAPKALESMGEIASNVTNGLVGTVVMLISAYVFIADKDKIISDFAKFVPEKIRITIRQIHDHLLEAVGGFLKAQFKIMGIIFLILLCGLILLGSPYAFLFALLIAFLDLLPVFGTGFVLIPWAIVDLLNSDYRSTVILVILYVICLFARQLLQPKIIGHDMGFSTLQTLVLIYVGYKFAGVKGMILALFVGIIFLSLYRLGLFDQKIQRVSRLITAYLEYEDE